MKLFTKYSRINIFSTVCIFLCSAFCYYFVLRYVLVRLVDENLQVEEAEIKTFISRNGRKPDMMTVRDQIIIFYRNTGAPVKRQFSSVQTVEAGETESEPFRQLVFPVAVGREQYTVSVKKSLEGTDALVKIIAIVTLITLVLMFSVSYYINKTVLQKLWKPFYDTIDKLQQYKIGMERPDLKKSGTDEFDLLNDKLSGALSKAEKDYRILKEFTENASHELQTPIAVMRSKMDVLIQDDNISQSQGDILNAAYNSLQRLSHLNTSLLLLTKIENNQFANVAPIDLQHKLTEKIQDLEELFESKHLSLQTFLKPAQLIIDPTLLDLLLNNLLGNVIKHSVPNSAVQITLCPGTFTVSNRGDTGSLEIDKIFNRFYKQNGNEGAGLGLSIVKQICDKTSLGCKYTFIDNMHQFSITWTT